MKSVEAGQFAENVDQYLQQSLTERIVVTQEGKPCAVVLGLNYDDEQLQLVDSAEFWEMIRERREGPTTPWEAAKQQLDALEE